MKKLSTLCLAFSVLAFTGCDKKDDKPADVKAAESAKAAIDKAVAPMAGAVKGAMKTAMATIAPSKNAATQPSNTAVAGMVMFTTEGDGVKVVVDLTGLAPGKHGIHIHEKSDVSEASLKSAGGHWNPDGHHHGDPAMADMHHAGDLGNLEAGADGKAHLEITLPGYTIGDGGKHDLVGHSVIVHAKEDDLKTDPAGNSGDRIAGGAIVGM
jgi:Cu-Zn family superoxide dismutase